jgi:threonine synthase
VCESLGGAPDTIVLPMGNAGNISAVWKGLREFAQAGLVRRLPRMIGVQAEGAAPIVRTLQNGADACGMEHPETVATAIRIGAPVNWRKALAAIRESGGSAAAVSDAAILQAQQDLAREEGLFVEPASAAPLAWLDAARPKDLGTVVCVATGHGLKDPTAVLGVAPTPRRTAPTLEALRQALEN